MDAKEEQFRLRSLCFSLQFQITNFQGPILNRPLSFLFHPAFRELRLLITQGLDGIESGRLEGGIKTGQDADERAEGEGDQHGIEADDG